MTRLTDRPPAAQRPRAGDLYWAWVSVLFIPVAAIVAFVLAGALYSAVGHDPSSETPPHWADAAALVPSGVLFAIPCVFALMFGRRAARAGRSAGWAPVAIAAVAIVGFTLMCLL